MDVDVSGLVAAVDRARTTHWEPRVAASGLAGSAPDHGGVAMRPRVIELREHCPSIATTDRGPYLQDVCSLSRGKPEARSMQT